MKIKITDLKISDRIRKDLGDIEDLAGSMARLGQLQPIIIDKDNRLVAGGRRVGAAATLGWTELDAVLYENCDEITHKDIELEENLRRKDLHWAEEVLAVKALYELRNLRSGRSLDDLGKKPGMFDGEAYSMEDAAGDLGKSKASISMDIALAKAVLEMPAITEEGSKNAAWKRYRREKETQIRTEQARRTQLEDVHPADRILIPVDDPATPRVDLQPGEVGTRRQDISKVGWKGRGMLYLCDCRDLLRVMRPETVDLIVTDPPFGLGMFAEGQTTTGQRLAQSQGTMYEDDPYKVMDMLDEVFMYAAKVLKPQGHCYVFFHMTRYEEVYQMLRKHFGSCEETPIIWIKNTPGIGDANINWVYAYEPCFFVNRGRHMVKPQAFNYLRYDTIPHAQKIHGTEKPAALLRHIIQASALPGEVVLDPFAGSGSTLVAAAQLGCRFIGVERHEPFHRSATERISEALGQLDQEAPPRQETEELVG